MPHHKTKIVDEIFESDSASPQLYSEQNASRNHNSSQSLSMVDQNQPSKMKRSINFQNQPQIDEEQEEQQTIETIFQKAIETNNRILSLRETNERRMKMLARNREQKQLSQVDLHYRGSVTDYPVIVYEGDKEILYPNESLRVSNTKLKKFIRKNIVESEEFSYLDEVVKFDNFCYQSRRRKRND